MCAYLWGFCFFFKEEMYTLRNFGQVIQFLVFRNTQKLKRKIMKSFHVLNTLYIYTNEHHVCFAFLLFPSACGTFQPAFPACGFVRDGGENTGVFLPLASPCSQLCSLRSPRLSEFMLLPLVPRLEAKSMMGRWGGRGIKGIESAWVLAFQALPKAALVIWSQH